MAQLSIQGCGQKVAHDEHTHEVIGRRYRVELKTCPGKVMCAVCHKIVYRNMVQPLGAVTKGSKSTGAWKCSPRCR